MLKTLAQRFYMDEQAILVSNGLSTELICFPSDNFRDHKRYISTKIRHAMAYTTDFKDIDELNALKYIAPHGHNQTPDHYLVLGLYLFLEDECSRLNKPMTFLTALRESNTVLHKGSEYNSKELLANAKHALTKLGMLETHGAMLDEWYKQGHYFIQGEEHRSDCTANGLHGTYAKLAREISQQKELLGLNLSISYALGNRTYIRGASVAQVYAMTQQRLNTERHKQINGCIIEGDHMREERILAAIHELVPQPPPGYSASLEANEAKARGFLQSIPDSVLEVLCRDGYMFAYTDSKDITQCYPAKDLPGESAHDNAKAREGKALNQPRYHTIFLSNGVRENPADIVGNQPLKNKIVAQSILHEAMHVIISHLQPQQKERLKQAVIAVNNELASYKSLLPYFNNRLQTVDTHTLAQALSYESGLYAEYDKRSYLDKLFDAHRHGTQDTRWEEVACNMMGLLYTEHPYPSEPGLKDDPYGALKTLAPLAEEINIAAQEAVNKCRENNSNIRLMLAAQAASRRRE